MGLDVPGSLSLAAMLYFCIPSFGSYFLALRLYRYENKRKRIEGRLRYSLIATLYEGRTVASRFVYKALAQILVISKLSFRINVSATFLNFCFGGLSMIVPLAILLPFYFSGEIAFGEVIKAIAGFTIARSAFAYFYTNFREVVRCLSALMRIEIFAGLLVSTPSCKLPSSEAIDFHRQGRAR